MIYPKNKFTKPTPTVDMLNGLREYALYKRLEAGGIPVLSSIERVELFALLRAEFVRTQGHSGLDEFNRRGLVISFREWLTEYQVEFDIGEPLQTFAIDEQSIRDHDWNMYTIVSVKPVNGAQEKNNE